MGILKAASLLAAVDTIGSPGSVASARALNTGSTMPQSAIPIPAFTASSVKRQESGKGGADDPERTSITTGARPAHPFVG